MTISFQFIYALIPSLMAIGICFRNDQYPQNHVFWQNQIWRMGDVSIVFVTVFFFQLFYSIYVKYSSIAPFSISVYGSFIHLIFLSLCIYIVLFRRNKCNFEQLGITKSNCLSNLGYGFIAFLLYFVFIGCLIIIFDKQEFLTNKASTLLDRRAYQWPQISTLTHCLNSIVLAPLIEEIVYRGMIFGPCQRKIGSIGSICFTATIWSISHLDVQNFINFFIMGIILCTIYFKTRSLLPNIVFHSLINFSQLIYFFAVRFYI